MQLNESASIRPVRLHYRSWGVGPPRVVLIHGIGDGAFVWAALIERIGSEYAGIAVDLRGHGTSPWDGARQYSAAAHTADVAALLDELRLQHVVLVGHSLGAEVAIRVAHSLAPKHVYGLVMVDGGPVLDTRAALAIGRDMARFPSRYASVADFVCVLGERHPLADSQVLRDYAASALRRGTNGELLLRLDPAAVACMGTPEASTLWSALGAISCPMLLVRGAFSSLLPYRTALAVSQSLPRCRLVTVLAAGHCVPLDNPVDLQESLVPFLREVAPQPQHETSNAD